MLAISGSRMRRSGLAGFLGLLLFSCPADALRMLHTLRFMPIAALSGPCVGANLKLHRKTPPLPIETPRTLVIRKIDAARLLVPFDRGIRESWGGISDRAGVTALWPRAQLNMPDYLRSFLPSSPQNPVYPPAEPVPLSL